MDSQARHELGKAIQKEGTGLYEDPQRIKALLMDACPESRTEISLLVAAAEDEIPTRLARSSDSVLRDGEIARAIADLKRTRRLDHGAAEWVVRSWAWALGVLDREPSDDPVDANADVPVQASAAPGLQPGPPPQFRETSPYPGSSSTPPQQHPSLPPGYPVSSAGAQHLSAPPVGQPSESWPSGGFSSTPSGGQPPWPQGSQGSTPQGMVSGGWSGPPPTPGWPGSPAAPPRPGRGRLVAILTAAVVVVVLAVVGGVFLSGRGSTPPLPIPSPTTSPVVPPEPTPATAAEVNWTITNGLASFEIADSATVYSFGRKVGALQVSASSPSDELPVTSQGGDVNYQLQINMVLTDEYGGGQITLNGSGTITAYEGARYAVDIVKNSAGEWVATLSPQNGI